MDRREFIQASALAGAGTLLQPVGSVAGQADSSSIREFYVALRGNDSYPGTLQRPFATLERAKNAVREAKIHADGPIIVWIREGTYYLPKPLVFTSDDSGTSAMPIMYAAYGEEMVTLSGGRRLDCRWEPFRDGIMRCALPAVERKELRFTQLFVNGKRQTRARYPSATSNDPSSLNGYAEVAHLSEAWPPIEFHYAPATFTKKIWKRPQDAVVHLFPLDYWGNLQWEVRSVDQKENSIQLGWGGFQLNEQVFGRAATGIGKSEIYSRGFRSRFFVENVFEELDTPGEWYLDHEEGMLYYLPAAGVDLSSALVEAPVLEHVIEFRGEQRRSVQHVKISGFRIAHSSSTFLSLYEAPSPGDWTIHRGGAVFLEGTENCSVENSFLDAVGGNGIFLNNYNRSTRVRGNRITESGDSAICLVGSERLIQGTNRPLPAENRIENNLIHDCGYYGKQIAGIFLSISEKNIISHNRIYNMPRAAICVNDGWGGGHIIEFNHIHDTVRDTTDHGPFNSWGRSRFWCMEQSHGKASHGSGYHEGETDYPFSYPEADGLVTILRNNLFQEPVSIHQLGIDLDDGSSHYHIYNNVCIGIGIKLREGDYRIVENNIFINPANPPAFHQGYEGNHDRFVRNIIVTDSKLIRGFGKSSIPGDLYQVSMPPVAGPIAAEIDYNLFFNDLGMFFASVTPRGGSRMHHTLEQWQQLGYDQHSVFADPNFADSNFSGPGGMNFKLKPGSLAIKMGIQEFDLSTVGLLPDFPRRWLDRS